MFFEKREYKPAIQVYGEQVLIGHLENKYGIKFIPIGIVDEGNHIDFQAYPEGGDKDKDRVNVTAWEEDGKECIDDDYFFETIREEVDAYIRSIISKYFESYKLIYNRKLNFAPLELKVGDTYEYIREQGIKFIIDANIIIDDDINKIMLNELTEQMLREFASEKAFFWVKLCHVRKGYLGIINEKNYRQCFSGHGDELFDSAVIELKYENSQKYMI